MENNINDYQNNSDNFENVLPDAKKSSYSLLDALVVFLLAVVIMIIASFAITGGASVIMIFNDQIIYSEGFSLFSSLIVSVSFILLYFFYNKKQKIDYTKASAIKKEVDAPKVLLVLVFAFVCLFLISPFVNILVQLFEKIGYTVSGDIGFKIEGAPWRLVVALIVYAVMPAIAEELIFRGIIFNGLAKKLRPLTAILLSALFFTLIHGSLQQTVFQFILGVVLGYIMYYSANLIYPILFHFFNNAIVVVVAYFSAGLAGADTPVLVGALDYILPIVLAALTLAGIVHFSKYLRPKKDWDEQGVKVDFGNKEKYVFSKEENFYFTIGLVISIVLWLASTAMGFIS